ncbi:MULTISPECIES: hypothetical protein [Bacteroides]|uniref:hypothetical protein n=1 Tax=Bacteroides TaxID=816 RepID=UPI00319E3BE1
MWSAIASIAGNIASNANINNQISEQKRENQANRDWNLNLAKLQNQWNIDQWNRENAYNSPSAQMARYKAAGLNPDLIYGQPNLSAASPEMTSGDGSLPTDVSNLANKRTMLDIVSASLDNDIKREQVKSMKNQNALDSRKVDTEQALSYLTGDILSVENTDLASKLPFRAYQQYLSLVNSAKDSVNKTAENESRLVDLAIKKLDRKFKEESMQTMLEDLSEKLKITKAEAEYYVKTVSLRIEGLKMDNKLKENEDFWNSPGFLEKLPDGFNSLLRILMAIRNIIR